MSTMAGFHVPVIPLVETVGKTGGVLFIQTDWEFPNEKVGVIMGLTVTVTVTGGAQGSEAGVNVYVPLAVLLTTAGLQVPVMPFVEVVGNTGAVSPEQIDSEVPKLKTGVILGLTVTA